MKVLLQNKELWERFRQHQTEMMITKSGRRMCPVISLKFEDLTPRQFYTVMIDFVLMDEFRYSFDAGTNTWLPYCREMPVEEGRAKVFVHAETPWNGATLMTNGLTFKTLKLTNSPKTAEKSSQAILLSTMRRYTPRIHVLESPNGIYFDYKLRKEFYFSEMEFIAVSQYRNKNITKLKIDANPFASAYRRDGLHGQAKRRRMEGQVVCEDERTSDDGPPSNSSSVQDSIVNGDELDKESNQSSSNEHPEESSPEESFISDKQQLHERHLLSPSQEGISKAVPEVTSLTQAELNIQEQSGVISQEKLSTGSLVNQNQTPGETSDSESKLMCEESREWIWGFDQQMLVRHEFENFIEGSQITSHETRLQNNSYAKEPFCDETKASVNRRKKYVPRRFQRRDDLSSVNTRLDSKDKEQTIEGEAVDKNNLNKKGVKLPQLSNTNSAQDTRQSEFSRCSEELGRTPNKCNSSHQPETLSSYVDAVLPSSVRTKAGVLFVIGQNASQSVSIQAEEPVVTVTSSSSRTEVLTGSSLDALIALCSKAGTNTLGNRDSTEIVNSQTVNISSLEATNELVHSKGSDSPLCKETEEESINSFIRQRSAGPNCTTLVSLTPQTDEQKTVGSCVFPMSSQCSGRASTFHATVTTFAVNKSSESTLITDLINETPKVTDTYRQSPTVTVECRAGATVVTKSCVENPIPVIVETYSGSHLSNGSKCEQQLDRKQTRYKRIAPAPRKSVNASLDEPACTASVSSSGCDGGVLYPKIVDSFTLANCNGPSAAEKSSPLPNLYFIPPCNSNLPQINQAYASSPYFGVTPVDNNFMQEFRLEKFYSLSSTREPVKSPVRPQARYYKTTRTNFSRLSLEPICSVIHPLEGLKRPSLSDNSAITEVSAQRPWGWRS